MTMLFFPAFIFQAVRLRPDIETCFQPDLFSSESVIMFCFVAEFLCAT